jgi:hypothetical protein
MVRIGRLQEADGEGVVADSGDDDPLAVAQLGVEVTVAEDVHRRAAAEQEVVAGDARLLHVVGGVFGDVGEGGEVKGRGVSIAGGGPC